jgi:hypothetical protein
LIAKVVKVVSSFDLYFASALSRQKITSISHPPPRRALFREEEARKNNETINNNNLKGPALRNSKGGKYGSPHISSFYYNKI